ncbi:MAG: hypothetical protein SGJ24_04590 [Chloroflexota bacterium]|nr:hypothetical protein [Chloroflexota bacterium]
MKPALVTFTSGAPLLCAWVSRHLPLTAHRTALSAYQICQVPDRNTSAPELWLDVVLCCASAPALVVLITSHTIYTPVIRLMAHVSPATVVIRPVMTKPRTADDAAWQWSGEWQQLVMDANYQRTYRVTWTPEPSA